LIDQPLIIGLPPGFCAPSSFAILADLMRREHRIIREDVNRNQPAPYRSLFPNLSVARAAGVAAAGFGLRWAILLAIGLRCPFRGRILSRSPSGMWFDARGPPLFISTAGHDLFLSCRAAPSCT
jgi:hypothetical protein